MRTKTICLASVLVLAGCAAPTEVSDKVASTATSAIKYAKDYRTGLCFALIQSTTKDGWDVVSLSNVPCANVEDFLVPLEQKK